MELKVGILLQNRQIFKESFHYVLYPPFSSLKVDDVLSGQALCLETKLLFLARIHGFIFPQFLVFGRRMLGRFAAKKNYQIWRRHRNW